MTLNEILIKEKLNNAKKYLKSLNGLLSHSIESFIDDLDLQLKGERLFEVLTQIILDVCTHIIANMEVDVPSSYSDCMKTLVKLNIILENDAKKYITLIKMRNLVVHQYGSIDYQILYRSLKTLEKDFIGYQDSILAWIGTQKG